MQAGISAMKTALRVLAALTDRKDPDPADVAELRSLAPLSNTEEIDEMACNVIRQALQRRAELRSTKQP
jgi:hypothetical protein